MLKNFQISKSIIVFIKINFFLIVSLNIVAQNNTIIGIDKTEEYLPLIIDKNIAIVSNHTSQFIKESKSIHLVDSLLKLNVQVKKVFAPEHGFRGNLDAGEKIINSIDPKTGIPIVSLYGKKRKPSFEDLDEIDVIIFDIQDVGARFYTYLSTMHYVMESCAENNIELIVLDRPNPNGHYIDGPVMVKLKVIEITNYDRNKKYKLTFKPSPNLPNQQSINLYPSLCFFEQTPVSVGRGTDKQFQVIGTPHWENFKFNFTPKSMPGAKYPKHENLTCYGLNLENEEYLSKIDLKWLILAYKNEKNKENFFKSGFHRLAGNKLLEEQIKKGLSEEEIRKTWKNGLDNFKLTREKYLIYN